MDAAISSYNKKQQSNLELMQRMIDNNNVVDRWGDVIEDNFYFRWLKTKAILVAICISTPLFSNHLNLKLVLDPIC